MSARRPTTLDEMRACLTRFVSDESLTRALAFRPRPTDILISPYAKCGTTWVQQIVHGLRSGGSMAFDEITEVVPWLELAHDMGVDPDAPQVAAPRAYKSHLSWDRIPKGGRYIVVTRDPRDALLSMHRFFEGWLFEPGSISVSDFARGEFMARPRDRSYWGHLASWWPQRDRPDVLMLCYEEMREDLPGAVADIAGFMGIEPDADLTERVVRQAGIGFMRANARQFDDHRVRDARDAVCGLPSGGATSKVRRGRSGGYREALCGDLIAEMDRLWRREITPRLGFDSYEALRRAAAGA